MRSKELRLKREFSVVAHSPDVIELRSGVWNTRSITLTDQAGQGRLYDLLVGLDGTASPREVAKRAGVSRTDVEALLDRLRQLGAVEPGPSSALDAYLELVWPLRAAGGERPEVPPVVVLGAGALAERIAAELAGSVPAVTHAGPTDACLRALAATELGTLDDTLAFTDRLTAFEGWRGSVLVHAEEVVDPARLTVLNRITLALRVPLLHVAIDGPFVFVGPFVVPWSSACYECFETRVAMNLRESAGYQKYKDALVRAAVRLGEPPALEPVRSLAAAHAALEVVTYAHTGAACTVGKVLGVYLPSMEIAYNEVLRLPGCAGCGSLPERDAGELYFDVRAWLDE